MIREDGTVVFEGAEQAELDRIVGERLSREKAKYSDYDDLKGLDEELKSFGYEGTVKERREAIKAQREAVSTQAELEELQKQSQSSGTSPEILAEIREARKEAKEANDKLKAIEAERTAKENAANEQKAINEAWDKQVKEFNEEYADVDLDQLALNPKFKKFIKGKALPLKELYEDFIDFIGETETDAIKKVMSKENRSTSGGKGTNSGGSYGLTDSQKKTVDEWNTKNPRMKMSYKEYAEKL